jgi:ribosomal protein S18 acetylase RimI-like enzyme
MDDFTMPSIERVSSKEESALLPHLIHLLQDAVDSGASVGFLAPLSAEEAQDHWSTIFEEIAQGTCVLLVAREEGQIIGSVQLALAMKPNAQHRAEVQKLFVLSSQRRRGIGRALMQKVEQAARDTGRTLLVLDTRQGDSAEQLYRTLGYCEVGTIPAYARSVSGTLDSTIIFYKTLPLVK